MALLSGSKLNFFPSNHTNALYDIDINPHDLASAKKIKIVCKKLPQVSATVALLTDDRLVTYIYDESDETTRLEIKTDKINGKNGVLNAVAPCFCHRNYRSLIHQNLFDYLFQTLHLSTKNTFTAGAKCRLSATE